MNSKIQQLTETIYKEGLQKARDEEVVILKEAREKAAGIERNAMKEAERILAEAGEKAKELRKQVDSEIKMTMNQAVSAIKQEINSLITMNVLQPPVKELFSDKSFLQTLITTIVKGWIEKESYDLKIILPESERGKLDAYFKNSLAKELNKGLEVSFSPNMKSGFKIGPAGEGYLISFSDEDFINFLKGYLRPKTSQLLFEERK
jgi:V/A-type H+/Na+-transporting ATPase subunit E